MIYRESQCPFLLACRHFSVAKFSFLRGNLHFKKNIVSILSILFLMVVLNFEHTPKTRSMIGRQKC